jgi:integrase/recombinase XerD
MNNSIIPTSPLTHELDQATKSLGYRSTAVNTSVTTTVRKGVIYIVLKHGKRKKIFSSNIKFQPKTYNSSTHEIDGEPLLTTELQGLIFKCKQYISEFKVTGRDMDLELIKGAALGLVSATIPTVQELFDRFYNQRIDEYNTHDLALGTLKKERTWHRHIKGYFSEKYGIHAPISRIVPHDAKAFVIWLKGKRGYSHNSAQMAVAHIKRVLNFAIENRWIIYNPFMNFRKKMELKKLEYLSESEIEKLEKLNLLDERLRRINDVFLFMIYTGLAYIDCQSLRKNNLYDFGNSELYIVKERGKTQVVQTIYLTKKALKILIKYEDDPYCNKYGFLVPILSNQKINTNLKAIGAIAGITKKLTCHLARKTFATVMYNAGADEKTMREIMGHTTINTTLKHYATIHHKTTVESMKKAVQNTSFGT